jgi:hypothetical protein
MTDHDPAELDEREEVIVALLGRYIDRRETRVPPRAHDLLAAAAEFGEGAADGLLPPPRSTRRCAQPRAPPTTRPRGAG